MSCGTGECGCGCGELLHIHAKPPQPFATEVVLAGSRERTEDSGS